MASTTGWPSWGTLRGDQRALIAARLATRKVGGITPIGAISQAEAAALVKVSKRQVQRVTQVRKAAVPELVKAVERDGVSLSAAAAARRGASREDALGSL